MVTVMMLTDGIRDEEDGDGGDDAGEGDRKGVERSRPLHLALVI